MKTNVREPTLTTLSWLMVSQKLPAHFPSLKPLYQVGQEGSVSCIGQQRQLLARPQLPCKFWDLTCYLQGTVLYTYAEVAFLAQDL